MYNLKDKQAQYFNELEAMKNKYTEVKNFLAQLELEIIRKDAIIAEISAMIAENEAPVEEAAQETKPEEPTSEAVTTDDDKVLEV